MRVLRATSRNPVPLAGGSAAGSLGEQPSAATIARIAGLQAAELQRGGTQVGRLSIATLTPHGITLLAPQDIVVPPVEEPARGAEPALEIATELA